MLYRFLVTTLLLTSSVFLNAQSLEKLDKANGFKEFKFGKPKSKWENDLKLSKNGSYRYLGTNAKAAFGSGISKLYLRFDSLDRLSGVYIRVKGLMGKSGVRGYRNIIGMAYGKESTMDDDEKMVSYYWHASKVHFVLTAWENGNTWDAELDFTSPEQYAADNASAKNRPED